MDESKIKYAVRGKIIAESNNIYTIETDKGEYLPLKRHCFILEKLSNDIKIAVIQNIIDKHNDKSNKKGSNKSKSKIDIKKANTKG